MGLSSALDWWDEWKLRVLVLCSLFVHSFLFFSTYVRKWYALRRLRVLVWIAYIGGDALAIYALATLFNRQKQQTMADGGGGSSSALEVTWAPVLLIHLGGQHAISAYSLEDNELWKRHAITLVSQVTVALYVFCKWWMGEKRLLQAAVLLFIVGILRFSLKPWALRRASYGSMPSTTYLSSPPRRERPEAEESCSRWSQLWRWCTTDFCSLLAELEEKRSKGYDRRSKVEKGTRLSLETYLQEAQEHVKDEGRLKIRSEAQLEKFKKERALARNKKPPALMKLAASFSYILRDYINKHLYIRHKAAAQRISMLVRQHAEDGWKDDMRDVATYRRFNNFRGGVRTLRKHKLLGQEQLGWSMDLPFDECVLLWHIATDLCLHHQTNSSKNAGTASSSQSETETHLQILRNSEIISNYMVYLSFICPDMLMLGTRQDLFMIACEDIGIMIKDEPPSSLDKSGIAQLILRKQQDDGDLIMIPEANKLARALIDLHKEER